MTKRNIFYFLLKLNEDVKGFLVLLKTFDNWHKFVLAREGIIEYARFNIKSRFGRSKRMSIDGKAKIISISVGTENAKFFYTSKRQFDNAMKNIYQTFIQEQYSDLNVKGKRVIDIGANNGDSAIYFVSKGAAKVYAYEPYTYVYRTAKNNIKLNNMQNKISINNQAVLDSPRYINIDDKYEGINSTVLEHFNGGKKIRVVGLDGIVKKYRLNHAVLKIDCEGGEYDILLNAKDSSLKKFDQIAVEYHFGYEKILNRLRTSGFNLRYTQPKIGRNSETNGLRMSYGMIYGHR